MIKTKQKVHYGKRTRSENKKVNYLNKFKKKMVRIFRLPNGEQPSTPFAI